jgi:hypothetical protein
MITALRGITYTALDPRDERAIDDVKAYAVTRAISVNGCSCCSASVGPEGSLIVCEWLGRRILRVSILCSACAKPHHGKRAS